MSGMILLAAGCLRAGNLIAFVPEPVINGFTIGIAIIIATSQLKDLFGLDIAQVPAEFFDKLTVLWASRSTFSGAVLAVGITTIALMAALRRAAPRLPGLIVFVGLTSAMVALAAVPIDTLRSQFGELPRTLPIPAVPDITLARVTELLPSAL